MPRGASLTAEAVCFFRAVETRRPPEGRLLIDPYAEHLLKRLERTQASLLASITPTH